MRNVFLTMLTLLLCMGAQAQENQYLRDITEAVKWLRKGNDKVRKQFENSLSSSGKPKISLIYLPKLVRVMAADGISAHLEIYLPQIIASKLGRTRWDMFDSVRLCKFHLLKY